MDNGYAEVLSAASNAAMVQLPTRRFPSMCLQGDTLVSLAERCCAVTETLLATGAVDEDTQWNLRDVANHLAALAFEYDRVLTQLGQEKPYVGGLGRIRYFEHPPEDDDAAD